MRIHFKEYYLSQARLPRSADRPTCAAEPPAVIVMVGNLGIRVTSHNHSRRGIVLARAATGSRAGSQGRQQAAGPVSRSRGHLSRLAPQASVGALFAQQLHHLRLSVTDCQLQRGPALFILGLNVGASHQQQMHQIGVAGARLCNVAPVAEDCPVQRGLPVVVLVFELGALGQQQPDVVGAVPRSRILLWAMHAKCDAIGPRMRQWAVPWSALRAHRTGHRRLRRYWRSFQQRMWSWRTPRNYRFMGRKE